MTWRVSEELLERVRRQAAEHGRSLNDWVTTVLAAVSDPAHADSATDEVRERLAHAGLLQPTGPAGSRPAKAAVARARAAAGRGTSLATLVADGRR